MRRFAALVLLTLLGAALGSVAAPQALADDEKPASQLAAAGELIDALGIKTDLEDKIIELETRHFRTLHADASGAVVADYTAAFSQAFDVQRGGGRVLYEKFYAGKFTEPELKALAAFFRTDLGQKYLAAQSDLQEDVHIMTTGLELKIQMSRKQAEAALRAKGELP